MNALLRRGWNEANVSLKTPLKADRGASKAKENRKGVAKAKKGSIPIFFATDDNYLPFLSVTLESMWENCSREYDYELYVLHSGVRREYEEKILAYNKEGFHISFVDVTARLATILQHLHIDLQTAQRKMLDESWKTENFRKEFRIVPWCRFYLPLKGEAYYSFNNRRYTLRPGSILLIPPFFITQAQGDTT